MLDGYHILTLTHRDAPLEMIANAVVPGATADFALPAIKSAMDWDELMYLATCNRVTFVFYTQNKVDQDLAQTFLSRLRPELSTAQLEATASRMRLLHGADAVTHLLEVAASMDSLVIGEREIIRQLKLAYEQSREWKITGDHLRLLHEFTIETAKEIYTHTGIGRKALSVVALAFNAMLKTGLKNNARLLMIGAGETNTLFGKFLVKAGFNQVTVFNRSYDKARALAEPNGWRAFPLDELAYYSEGLDAIVVCTGATEPILTPDLYRALLGEDMSPKIVVDLSIPHNVAKETIAQFPVQYVEIEGLKEVANENLAYREQERLRAAELIAERLYDFRERWHERQVERAFAHVPEEVRAVKERALNEVFGKEFAALDPAAQELVQRMLGYMEKKCVAIPIKAAKAVALRSRKPNKGISLPA